MKKIYDYGYLLGLGGLVILLDQWTKALVRTNLPFGEAWSPWPWLAPFASIVHWKNTGAAFGMLPKFGDVFMGLAILVALAILYYFPQVPKEDWYLRLAMGLQFGGAIGNLIDRITQGGQVTDFVALFSIWHMPVFNVADASISVGVVVLLLGVWIKERQVKKLMAPESSPEGITVSPVSAEPEAAESTEGRERPQSPIEPQNMGDPS
jgi:signal peptidase II